MPPSESTITDRDSPEQAEFVQAGIEYEDVLVTEIDAREASAPQWDDIIDRKLIKWGSWQNDTVLQEGFEAEGFISPTSEAILKAYRIVANMRQQLWPLPTGVIPDGEGGIVFENKQRLLYQRMEIDQNGETSLATFNNAKLFDRRRIDIE